MDPELRGRALCSILTGRAEPAVDAWQKSLFTSLASYTDPRRLLMCDEGLFFVISTGFFL
jgi:hypothetical protein